MPLRHTAITRLAEANCEFGLIASVSGHQPDSIGQILNRYWQPTSRQAQEAFRRHAEHEGEGGATSKNFAAPLWEETFHF